MSEKSEKRPSLISRATDEVIKYLVVSDQESKTQTYGF